jgi:endonuclease/exonuclease/phosphatase (EEP) superfamily protein YafD
MSKLAFYITLFLLLVLSACVSIPSKHLTVSQRGNFSAVKDANDCDSDQHKNMRQSDPAQKMELDSSGFRILIWNVYKGIKEGWKDDFKNLIPSYDILTIQEARLTDDMQKLLQKGHDNWDISIAFKFNGKETGVLTASRIAPDFTCTFRTKEPLASLPKTTMVTLYPLSNTDKTLMVVNIHSINLTLGTGSFKKQLQKVENILSLHYGPVIISGDVNTWSSKRMAILTDFSNRLGLKAVPFNKQDRTRVFGRAIDHIYYRELTVTDAEVIKVTSSDHNPMLVSFRLEESRG